MLKERDWGYSIGGPIGKPGGNNKLFFFYSQEFSPRTAGNNVVRFRMPTALERAGDFSQSTDQNGALYPYIKDPLLSGACTAADQTACFRDGGVVGRIPASRLYQPGLNILKLYPLPNIANVPAAQNYNYEITRPEESVLSLAAGGTRRLSADAEAARQLQVLGLDAAQPGLQRHDPRLQRHQDAGRAGRELHRLGQLHADADDVHRGDLRAQSERAGRVRAGAVVDRRHLLQQRRRHVRASR